MRSTLNWKTFNFLSLGLLGLAVLIAPTLALAQDAAAAKEDYEACRALLEEGKPCQALKKCDNALEKLELAPLVELTQEARSQCQATLPKNSKDSDKDGIPDKVDRCPNDPEDKDGFDDADGCPDTDNDHDGRLDGVDGCPNQAEDLDGFEDDDGCLDGDNDGDGVSDEGDRCPGQAEDLDGFKDDDGCPDLDNDDDGLADAEDQCPLQAEDQDGFKDDDGCPDSDNDNDGVTDTADSCPDQPEDLDGDADQDGCPDTADIASILGWTSIGTGLVLLGGGTALFIVGSSLQDEVNHPEKVDGVVRGMTQQEAQQQFDDGGLYQGLGIGLMTLGGALAITGPILFLASSEDDEPKAADQSLLVIPGPGSVTVEVRF
ncbi:MAG: hypothetical protein CO108_16935 [Deltaproteobacteria bacterium CG_4_9_14_3_um_filter_63_12]|nr:MAG: hypothetical protein CO108_16935 [Deltaproteobacteria bacterium CG_4_9_14_3_um_filter_63_12]